MDEPVYKGAIRDRMDVIGPLVTGRKTLDLGIVDSIPGAAGRTRCLDNPRLLFAKICKLNPDTIGVDMDAEGIAILAERGYNVVTADVMTMDLGTRFDTIIAGEIIEHLANPGQFLENMRRHLAPGGTLLITTPNPFYFKQIWTILRQERPLVHVEHTCWFDPITLSSLCRRSGLVPYEIYWIRSKKSLRKTWPQRIRDYFSHSFITLARVA